VQYKDSEEDEMVNFKNQDFNVPPSFGWDLLEDTLKDDKQPYVLWAMLKIPMPENSGWAADAMFNHLADFIEVASEEDKKFMVFLKLK